MYLDNQLVTNDKTLGFDYLSGNQMEWSDYGYVVVSKYRKEIVLALLDHPKTPNQLSDQLRVNVSHVSRALRELTQKQIVSCLAPNRIKGRVYGLTGKGTKIANIIKSNRGQVK